MHSRTPSSAQSSVSSGFRAAGHIAWSLRNQTRLGPGTGTRRYGLATVSWHERKRRTAREETNCDSTSMEPLRYIYSSLSDINHTPSPPGDGALDALLAASPLHFLLRTPIACVEGKYGVLGCLQPPHATAQAFCTGRSKLVERGAGVECGGWSPAPQAIPSLSTVHLGLSSDTTCNRSSGTSGCRGPGLEEEDDGISTGP